VYPPLPSPSREVAVSTRDPPREQWLAGLGAGAGLSFVSWRPLRGVRSCILPSPPLPSPPRRVTWPLAPTIHPASSGSQGWGRVLGCRSFRSVRCVAFVAWRSFLHPPLPSPHRRVTWPLAPAIHPASSGSQGWGGCWVVRRRPSFMLPISTPRAAAHGGGWGCCGGCPSVSCVSSAGGGCDVAGGAYLVVSVGCVASSFRRFVISLF